MNASLQNSSLLLEDFAMTTFTPYNNSACEYGCSTSNNNLLDLTNNTDSNSTVTGPPFTFPATVFMGLLAGIGSIITILGNLIVITSFIIERAVRQPTNYFIASLALSDLLIGTFSMPLYTTYLLLGYWPLGPWICDLWLSLDWTVCLASQYTVFAITADRFCSVIIPAKYRNWRTDRKVRIIVAMVWIIPTSIFFTTIIGWQYFAGGRTIPPLVCDVAFMHNKYFSLLLTIGYYWITLAVMSVLYAGIYNVALQLQRKSDAKQKKMNSTIGMMCDQLRLGISMTHGNVMQNADTLDIPKAPEHMNNGRANNTAAVTTTSFTTNVNNKKEKDDDRSSSPCFPSDEENSSQSSTHPRPHGTKGSGKHHKTTRKQKGTVDETAKLVKSPSEHRTMSKVPELDALPEFHVKHVSVEEIANVNASINNNTDVNSLLQSREYHSERNIPNVESFDDDTYIQQKPNIKSAIVKPQPLQPYIGNMYIDMDCLKSFISFENIKLIDDISDDEVEPKDDDNVDERMSPIWKKRASLQEPIAVTLPSTQDLTSPSQLTFEINADKPSTSSEGTAPAQLQPDPMTDFTSKSNFSKSTSSEKSDKTTQCDGIVLDPVETLERPSRLASFVKFVGSRRPKKIRAKREREKGQSKSENRARKALRTITVILGAFILCWTPYHIFLLVVAFCQKGQTCLSVHIYNFSYWLCYLNSPINPFCYAFANAQFKRTFIRILKFDWHRT